MKPDTEQSGLALAIELLAAKDDHARALLDIVPDQKTATHENILIGAAREIDELREGLARLLHDYTQMERYVRTTIARIAEAGARALTSSPDRRHPG